MPNFKKLLIAAVLSSCVLSIGAHAALITVDSGCTIQEAVISANTGAPPIDSSCEVGDDGLDLISVGEHEDVQLNNANGDDSFMEIDSSIIIRGNRAFVLDANSSARHFYVTSNGDLSIIGGTLTGGRVDSTDVDIKNGGAIYSDGGKVSLSFSSIVNNRVSSTATLNAKGAAIFMNGGELSLERSLISGNQSGSGAIALSNNAKLSSETSFITHNIAKFEGGGIFTDETHSIISLNNSNVTTNSAASGGAVFSEGDTLIIDSGSVSDNSALVDSGAFYLNGTALELDKVSINGNTARVRGGAIVLESTASLEVKASSFFNNKAESTIDGEGTGGAIYFSNLTEPAIQHSIVNATFSDNGAKSGGTFFISSASNSILDSLNNTILNPKSGQEGSAIFVGRKGNLRLRNSIVSFKDRVKTNAEFMAGLGSLCEIESGGTSIAVVSLIDDGTCGGVGAASGDPLLNGSRPAFNFNTESITVGRRVNNSTGIEQRMTVIQPRVHVPLFDSPVLDQGDIDICGLLGNTDQRGEPRTTDRCDIGAVEAKKENFLVSRHACNFESTFKSISDRKSVGNLGCKDGADLNTVSFTQEDIQNGFDLILNDNVVINSSVKLLGPGENVFKIVSNGGFSVGSSGRLYMRGLTIDGFSRSAIDIRGGGAVLENITVRNSRDPIVVESGRVVIKNAELESNVSNARSRAAGVSLEESIGRIENTSIVNNAHTFETDFTAGGIAVNFGSKLNIVNSTISGNSAQGNAGGIVVFNSTLAMTNTTVVNNSAKKYGGAIYIASEPFGFQPGSTSVNLSNSIIAGNSAELGGGEISVNRFGGPEVELTLNGNLIGRSSLAYHDAVDDVLGIVDVEINSQLLTETNLDSVTNEGRAPLSSVVNPLKRIDGSFIHSLFPESLARDAAAEQFCVNQGRRLQFDQVSSARDEHCDIGAIEYVQQDDSICFPIKLLSNKVAVVCI